VSSATPVTLLCCGLLGVTVDDGGILERAFAEAFATQGIVPGTAAYARSHGEPAVIPAQAWAGGLAAALLIGALAGLLPAIRAARLSPTEALWSI